MSAASNVRILLADDHNLVRAGIRALLENMAEMQIVGEASNGREAVELAASHRPDVVIMDISMRELNGIDATARIVAEVPPARVVILSMHATEEFVRRAFQAGASAYLVKDSAPLELRLAVDAVMKGEAYVCSRISRHLVSALTRGEPGAQTDSIESLTPRQREVLQLVAEGGSTRDIAAALGVSVKTVESHRAALMDRLGIDDVAGLVLYAVRHGLVDVDRLEK